jgi:uncharacterized protein YjbJ (UPF0337 family)
MKQSTKDQAAGKAQVVKGKIKEKVGQVSGNMDLENEGTTDRVVGKGREVIGKIEKAAGA